MTLNHGLSVSLIIKYFIYYRDRLSASDMLQVRKVLEHVYEKVMGSDGGSTMNGKGPYEGDEELSSISEDKVELLCQDQVSHNNNKPFLHYSIPRGYPWVTPG